jgi:hypothetical protein
MRTSIYTFAFCRAGPTGEPRKTEYPGVSEKEKGTKSHHCLLLYKTNNNHWHLPLTLQETIG